MCSSIHLFLFTHTFPGLLFQPNTRVEPANPFTQHPVPRTHSSPASDVLNGSLSLYLPLVTAVSAVYCGAGSDCNRTREIKVWRWLIQIGVMEPREPYRRGDALNRCTHKGVYVCVCVCVCDKKNNACIQTLIRAEATSPNRWPQLHLRLVIFLTRP